VWSPSHLDPFTVDEKVTDNHWMTDFGRVWGWRL